VNASAPFIPPDAAARSAGMTDKGQPVPVVLIHGLIGDLRIVAESGAFGRAPVLAPNLLGYGDNREASASAAEIGLPAQVEWLEAEIAARFGERPVHLVGHSVGGAVAMLFAHRYPQRVAELVSIEGNFTLADAFWSASLAAMPPSGAEQLLETMKADPAAWLARSVQDPPAWATALAADWLALQPASTLQAMARSVVEETGSPSYLDSVREVFARHPVHLIAGERSRDGWDVPAWAWQQAASTTVIAGAGHLPMVDDREGFSRRLARMLGITTPEQASSAQ
jgi:lipase